LVLRFGFGSVSNEKRGDRRRSRAHRRRAEQGRGREASVRAFRALRRDARVVTRREGDACRSSVDTEEGHRRDRPTSDRIVVPCYHSSSFPGRRRGTNADEASAEHVPRTPSGFPSSERGHYTRGRSTSRSRACAAVSARREMAESRALSRTFFVPLKG